MKLSQRLTSLPPYLFNEIDRLKKQAVADGIRIIDFGIGDPDLPTPSAIIERCVQETRRPENHRYPSYAGMPAFREAVVDWYARRGVSGLDSSAEVIALIGSKEGIAHLPLACVDRGDIVLIPDPGYPVYQSATMFAGGTAHLMPLREEHGFLPDFSVIPAEIADRATLMFLNYPNNPTSGMADVAFFATAVEFCRRHEIILCHDASYLDMTFDGVRAPSLMEIPGAKEVGIEMISLSKSFNMTGWRAAAAVGNREVIKALLTIKMNIDSGIFTAIQHAAVAALREIADPDRATMAEYAKRRGLMLDCLSSLNWPYHASPGTFYLWVRCPESMSSMAFTKDLLAECGILATPGVGFGHNGEGYVRFSLTLPTDHVREAIERLQSRNYKPY